MALVARNRYIEHRLAHPVLVAVCVVCVCSIALDVGRPLAALDIAGEPRFVVLRAAWESALLLDHFCLPPFTLRAVFFEPGGFL